MYCTLLMGQQQEMDDLSFKRLACSIPFGFPVRPSHMAVSEDPPGNHPSLSLWEAVSRRVEPQRHDKERKLSEESTWKSDFVLSL